MKAVVKRAIGAGMVLGMLLLALGKVRGTVAQTPEPTPPPPPNCHYENGQVICERGGGTQATPTPVPVVCPSWTYIIVSGPHRDESRGQCYYIVQPYEQCSGATGDPETVDTDCPQPSTQNPCVDENGNPLFSVGPDGITCGRSRHMRSF